MEGPPWWCALCWPVLVLRMLLHPRCNLGFACMPNPGLTSGVDLATAGIFARSDTRNNNKRVYPKVRQLVHCPCNPRQTAPPLPDITPNAAKRLCYTRRRGARSSQAPGRSICGQPCSDACLATACCKGWPPPCLDMRSACDLCPAAYPEA